MYRLVTKYRIFGLRHEHDTTNHTNHMVLKPVSAAPQEFETEQTATDWALANHDDMLHHPDFVVMPVHHMVLTWRPEDEPPIK